MNRASRLLALAGSTAVAMIALCAVGGVPSGADAGPAQKKATLRGPGVTPKKNGQFRINLIGRDLTGPITKNDVTLTLKPSNRVIPLDVDPQIIGGGRILRLTATYPGPSATKANAEDPLGVLDGDDDTVSVDVPGVVANPLEVPLAVEP